MHRWFRIVRRRRRTRATGRREYVKHRDIARARIMERLKYWSGVLSLPYNRVAIRNQGTRWGSCSTKGNLNFNYRIAFLPEPLMDYVIIHELCHLAHFNHSRAFWSLVGSYLPEYRTLRAELKKTPIRGALPLTPSVVEVRI